MWAVALIEHSLRTNSGYRRVARLKKTVAQLCAFYGSNHEGAWEPRERASWTGSIHLISTTPRTPRAGALDITITTINDTHYCLTVANYAFLCSHNEQIPVSCCCVVNVECYRVLCYIYIICSDLNVKKFIYNS